jgi:serine/threonine protein kinase
MSHGSLTGVLLDGRYRITRLLGDGGMSAVHEAEDLQLGRRVAVKIAAGRGSATRAERLFREARAAARTNHPSVVTVYAIGSDPELELDYIVLELLEGESLAARLAEGRPLEVGFVRRIGIDVASALAASHAARVVHRDIKPANVFLARRGHRADVVTVLDFGIAKHMDLDSISSTDILLGTLPYVAPERLLDARHADVRTDVYSLGVMLYECLTGRQPFSSVHAADVVSRILAGADDDLMRLRPDVSLELARVVSRCMKRVASERFDSAAEVERALQALGG